MEDLPATRRLQTAHRSRHGQTSEQTILMPVGDNTAMATAVGGLLGLDGFDTWDPSLVATPRQAMSQW